MTCTNKGLTEPISVRLNVEATDGENLTKPPTTRLKLRQIYPQRCMKTHSSVCDIVCSPEAARHVPEHRVLFAALRGRWKRISLVEELVKQRGGHNGPTIWRKNSFLCLIPEAHSTPAHGLHLWDSHMTAVSHTSCLATPLRSDWPIICGAPLRVPDWLIFWFLDHVVRMAVLMFWGYI